MDEVEVIDRLQKGKVRPACESPEAGLLPMRVNPVGYVLRPISAYAAACECRGQNCSCGTACCDGYTEFCCTLTGRTRARPAPSPAVGGRPTAPSFCGGAARYYMDCNVAPGANPCSCGCTLNDCNHRVECCTHFRYGQCHQELPQLGAIMCRVVTCTPPWLIDGTCTTTRRPIRPPPATTLVCLHTPEGARRAGTCD